MSLASLHLVLRSTGVATAAIQALGSVQQVFPDGTAVVQESLQRLTRSLLRADFTVLAPSPPLLSRPPPPLPKLVFDAIAHDTAFRPKDPIFIEQEVNGCKALLLEVIRRAAHDWVLYRTSRRMIQKKLAEDAYTWLFVEKPGHPNWIERDRQGKHITSFLSICSELDLDVNSVRMYVRKLTLKNVKSVGRPVEYRRRDSCPPMLDEDHLPALTGGISDWDPLDISAVD